MVMTDTSIHTRAGGRGQMAQLWQLPATELALRTLTCRVDA
jgi:hypothetical protein